MSQAALQIVREVLGAGGASLDARTFEHMIVRAVMIDPLGLVIVRIGRKSLLGRTTAFDIVLAFILGLLLSRSTNGVAPPVPSLAVASVLVPLHWLVSSLMVRRRKLERLVKEKQMVVIRDGELEQGASRHQEVTGYDILETLRLRANRMTWMWCAMPTGNATVRSAS